MDNHEEILDALTAFGKSPNPQEIPSILEQYLNCVAKNGETLFPWSQLKPLILRKMELVILELRRNLASENIPTRPNVENVRFDVIHARIIDSLHKFNGAPFTIQRLCELLTDPKRHYKRSDKFMRGLEKNVLVVSTVDPFGRKVVCESGNKPMVNGMADVNGSYTGRDSGLSVPLPPVPGWVKTSSSIRSTDSELPQEPKVPASSSEETSVKEKELVSNGVSGGIAVSSSELSDQGDPLAVHTEEVVEETVVTMDTSEVSSVDTDGGEAMAESDGMDRDVADDRDASSFSSSSSSSSSEELSTSTDTIESPVSAFEVPAQSYEAGANVDDSRPWEVFAQDLKHHEEIPSLPSSDISHPENETLLSESTQASQPSTTLSETTSSVSSSSSSSSSLAPLASFPSESQSSVPVVTTSFQQRVEVKKVDEDDNTHTSWLMTEEASPTNQSFPLESDKSSAEPTLPSVDCLQSAADQDKQASSSSSYSSSSSSSTTTTATAVTSTDTEMALDPLVSISSSSDSVRTYAQAVASSTDKTAHLEPYDSASRIPCDSVAGLEKLVGSVEQSLSSSSPTSRNCVSSLSSSSPNSSPFSLSSTDEAIEPGQQILPSSSDIAVIDDEPASKRPRLCLEEESMEEEDCISTSGESYVEKPSVDLYNQNPSHHQLQQQSTICSSNSQLDSQPQQAERGEEEDLQAESLVSSVTEEVEETKTLSSDSSDTVGTEDLEMKCSGSAEDQVCSNEADIATSQESPVTSNTESSSEEPTVMS